jgi:hypothetical protein
MTLEEMMEAVLQGALVPSDEAIAQALTAMSFDNLMLKLAEGAILSVSAMDDIMPEAMLRKAIAFEHGKYIRLWFKLNGMPTNVN